MHMKRKVPHLYLSPIEDPKLNLNDFNHVLKSSLLSPQKYRYVATKHEQEALQRQSVTQKQ